MNKKIINSFVLSACVATSQYALAVADKTHPRDYIPAPPGTNVAVFYYDQRDGDSFNVNGTEVASNADLDVDVLTARIIHYTEINGYTIDPQIVIPHGNLDLGLANQSSNGVGDVLVGAPIWLVNDNENKQWFSIAPFLWVPVGAYDEDQVVNFGTNTFRPVLEFGYVKGLTDKLYFDVVGGIEWSEDNDNPYGGDVLEKDEIYRLNTMLSYSTDNTGYVWGKYVVQKGGETTLDGVAQNNELDSKTLAVGYSKWISPTVQLQAEYSRDIEVENGVETDGFSLRLVTLF